jgi:hypothetical protein
LASHRHPAGCLGQDESSSRLRAKSGMSTYRSHGWWIQ